MVDLCPSQRQMLQVRAVPFVELLLLALLFAGVVFSSFFSSFFGPERSFGFFVVTIKSLAGRAGVERLRRPSPPSKALLICLLLAPGCGTAGAKRDGGKAFAPESVATRSVPSASSGVREGLHRPHALRGVYLASFVRRCRAFRKAMVSLLEENESRRYITATCAHIHCNYNPLTPLHKFLMACLIE